MLIRIDVNNIRYIENEFPSTFTYFRNIKIKKHVITLVFKIVDKLVGYGHLIYKKNIVWLGFMCVT